MRTITSRSHSYTVEECLSPKAAFVSLSEAEAPHFLVDSKVHALLPADARAVLPSSRLVILEASETAKSYGALEPVFLDLLQRGLKRSGSLVVVGGGVLQDAGCFVASVLARGIRWSLVPTTLLAQADSCIGSKSSINIGSFKNQIGTFYPPHRVLLVSDFLATLPSDEIRSGLGEVIKLQLLSGEAGYRELMADLAELPSLSPQQRLALLARWVQRSMDVKQPFIERDEFDRGPRLLLNYGHTFAHAFESTTDYAIPHGIAVVLGVLVATDISVRLGLADAAYRNELVRAMRPWHEPHASALEGVVLEDLRIALGRDKKNAATGLTCILTRGFGEMERRTLSPDQIDAVVMPSIACLIENGFAG